MLTLMLLAATLFAAELKEEDGFHMNDMGATVWLPTGWKSLAWSDLDLTSQSSDGLRSKVWFTGFQVPVTDTSLAAWSEMYTSSAQRSGFTDVVVADKRVEEWNGRTTGLVTLRFSIDKKIKGVEYVRCFESDGKVIHMRVVAARQRDAKARAALDYIAEHIAVDHGPAETVGPRVETNAGMAATLPDGWRAPLRQEMGAVRAMTGKVGEEKLSPDNCGVAIRPPAVGDPDVIFACKSAMYLGPLDEYSFEGVEAEVFDKFFGRADKPVPHGELVHVGDRVGIYYRPPVQGMATRMAIAPYEGGVMQMWGLGGQLDEAGLDQAMMAILPTVEFTGPDGGAPIIGFDKRLAYYIKYRTFSPIVIGPALLLLAIIGGFIAMARRKPSYDDLD